MIQLNVPYVDRSYTSSNHRFHVDGTTQNLLDAIKYLEWVCEYNDIIETKTKDVTKFPLSKRESNEMLEFINGFNWCYSRIPKSQKL